MLTWKISRQSCRCNQIGRRTVQICNQNIVFAIAVKVIILALVAAGFANMWAAVFADVGVAVIAILNANENIIL